MIEVRVFDDGVVCSECGEVAADGYRAPHDRAINHGYAHCYEDFSKVSVAGPMPRPITLTRQQIIDALTGLMVDATIDIKHPDDGCRIGTLLTGFDAAKAADALVAASETNR